jgi:hypothetical protein
LPLWNFNITDVLHSTRIYVLFVLIVASLLWETGLAHIATARTISMICITHISIAALFSIGNVLIRGGLTRRKVIFWFVRDSVVLLKAYRQSCGGDTIGSAAHKLHQCDPFVAQFNPSLVRDTLWELSATVAWLCNIAGIITFAFACHGSWF